MDLNNLVKGLANSGAVSGFAGGLAGTAVAGALTGKKGRKMAKSALKVGALAAVGGLAYTAYQRYRQQPDSSQPTADRHAAGQSAAQLTAPSAPDRRWEQIERQRFESVATDTGADASGGLLLVRAMIAAASADGHMDDGERERIFSETQRLDLADDEKARLFDELRAPLSVSEIVGQTANPETAIEVYAASLVAIDETRPEAQAYLKRLATALGLPDALIMSLHAQAALARQEKQAA